MNLVDACTSSKDCYLLQECINSICQHIPPVPGNLYTSVIYLITPILIGVGLVGGLGGGIIKCPVLELLLGYTQTEATFISYGLMFGGCVGNMGLLLKKRHPMANKPIIDFSVSMIVNTTIQLGDNIGVMLAIKLPSFIQSVLFEIFLLAVIPYLVVKYRHTKHLEESQVQETVQPQEAEQDQSEEDNDDVHENNENQSQEFLKLKRIKEYEQQIIYPKECGFILISILVTFLLLQLRSTPTHQSILGAQPCSWTDNLIVAAAALFTILWALFVFNMMKRNQQEKLDNGYQFLASDFQLTIKNYFILCFGGFLAGTVSGLIGLGAGLVLVPLMLKQGLHPRVTAATSGFIYLCISLTLMINVIIKQLLPFSTIAWFTFISFIGGTAITYPIYKLLDTYKIASFVILIVIIMALFNLFGNIAYVYIMIERYSIHEQLQTVSICP